MQRRLALTSIVLGLLVGSILMSRESSTSAAAEQAPEKKPALQKFMRAKLNLSQGLLEGLVVEDFTQLDRDAKALLVLSLAEQWNVSLDPLYKQHSEEFRRAVKQMGKAAQEKNLDGASLAYVQVTMSCIECHRYVRNQLIARQ